MEQQVTVAIIEDHPVVTEGVASWIRSDPGQRVRLVARQSVPWPGKSGNRTL